MWLAGTLAADAAGRQALSRASSPVHMGEKSVGGDEDAAASSREGLVEEIKGGSQPAHGAAEACQMALSEDEEAAGSPAGRVRRVDTVPTDPTYLLDAVKLKGSSESRNDTGRNASSMLLPLLQGKKAAPHPSSKAEEPDRHDDELSSRRGRSRSYCSRQSGATGTPSRSASRSRYAQIMTPVACEAESTRLSGLHTPWLTHCVPAWLRMALVSGPLTH